MDVTPILVVAPPTKRGDLFTRMMEDVLQALGYDRFRLNVQKSGREIDLEAFHRTERRRLIAECKATAKPVGGAAINKFVGTLDAERRHSDIETVGYFISLSGFTETAIEQERLLGDRVTLIDGKRVLRELVSGRIVVGPEQALERAGRCVEHAGLNLEPEPPPQILAHEKSWLWAVRYHFPGAKASHVALIHADGHALSTSLAEEILCRTEETCISLAGLTYLVPHSDEIKVRQRYDLAQKAYFNYLSAECGEVEFEGMPADQEVAHRSLPLEDIFVPLHLVPILETDQTIGNYELQTLIGDFRDFQVREPVGSVLSKCSRLAILAAPGAGKTTLMKRLASAYAYPDRRNVIPDALPERDWFPLFIRCRQLGDRTYGPITALLGHLGELAELGERAKDFETLARSALRDGRALLLIDGLDEIRDTSTRLSFVSQLRTFLAIYRNLSVVITSREAGYRDVAGVLKNRCRHFLIADLDRDDIERLTIMWHREIVGSRPDVMRDARRLADTIWTNDRIRRLAVNPLLLTTLLLVKRWLGQLPTRRTVLYEKAIEVLLMTWNVAGHSPLDSDEVLPQLAYLAWTMTKDGVQRVPRNKVRSVLISARKEMPEILHYAKLSVKEFLDRVELRSSILVQSGCELVNGELQEMYEFRHLTFQEYLAAKAAVEGFYPDRRDSDDLGSLFGDKLDNEKWKEVIALAAVLAGRRVAPLINKIILCISGVSSKRGAQTEGAVSLLSQCLLDEVKLPPELADRALEEISRFKFNPSRIHPVYLLSRSRYNEDLGKVIWAAFKRSVADLRTLAESFRIHERASRLWPLDSLPTPIELDVIFACAKVADERNHIAALLMLTSPDHVLWELDSDDAPSYSETRLEELWRIAESEISSSEPYKQYTGVCAMKWLSYFINFRRLSPVFYQSSIGRLMHIILGTEISDLRRICNETIINLPLVNRSKLDIGVLTPSGLSKIGIPGDLLAAGRKVRDFVLRKFGSIERFLLYIEMAKSRPDQDRLPNIDLWLWSVDERVAIVARLIVSVYLGTCTEEEAEGIAMAIELGLRETIGQSAPEKTVNNSLSERARDILVIERKRNQDEILSDAKILRIVDSDRYDFKEMIKHLERALLRAADSVH